MKRYLAALVLLCAGSCWADMPTAVGLHLYTAHSDHRLNNTNPGVYARWKNGLTIGTLTNSINRQSSYVAWTLADKTDTVELTVGGITGYLKPVTPLVVPSVKVGITEHWAARLSLLKAPGNPAAVHLSVEYLL